MSIFIQAFIAEIYVEVNILLVNIELNIYKLRVNIKNRPIQLLSQFLIGLIHLSTDLCIYVLNVITTKLTNTACNIKQQLLNSFMSVLLLKLMKLQWSSSRNPLQYNTISIHIIRLHILHLYEHLHFVALLMSMLWKLIWYKRL